MKFGPVPVKQAMGGILAHAVKQGELVLKKGTRIGPDEIARLEAAGVTRIVVAQLEAGDVPEDAAAFALAEALAGRQARVEKPFTGRSNLFSEAHGVLLVDAARIEAVNRLDEAVTVATLPPFRAVREGEMIATVKIIPFAVPEALLAQSIAAAGQGAVRVAPFRPQRIGVVSTLLPGLKASVVDKTLRVLSERLAPFGSQIAVERRVQHDAGELAAALRDPELQGVDLIVVFGASAITDRRDVIPAAIESAGGEVEHFGMPVDPGNLLLLGRLSGRIVLGAPGCARSPKENGFDWVLQRLLADVPVRREDIQALGVGGLLMEIVSRPQPRSVDLPAERPPVAAIVLAAGLSSRMAAQTGRNKLFELYAGKPLLRHAVEAALASHAAPVLVVTGHQREAAEAALAGLNVRFVHNPDYASGLSSSLKAGIAAVPADCAGAFVLLGDMPKITPGLIDRMLARLTDEPQAAAVAPTVAGQRGNPVLLTRALFAQVAGLAGDAGARKLLDAAGDAVVEVAIDDDAVLVDVDTAEALARLRQEA